MKLVILVVGALALGLFVLAQDPPRPPVSPSKPEVTGQGEVGKAQPKPASQSREPKAEAPAKPVAEKPVAPKVEQPAAREPAAERPKVEQPKVDAPVAEQPAPPKPIPAGTDPRDLAAMKSAEQMLEAERQLNKLVKEGKIDGIDRYLSFDVLTAWPYEEQLEGMPKEVRALSGKKVMMSGFMLPIDEVQNIREFILVQSLWACCYGQPPDINGIVRCVMPGDKRTDYYFDPLKIVGEFKVEATLMDGYCVDIFQLHVSSLEPIKTGK